MKYEIHPYPTSETATAKFDSLPEKDRKVLKFILMGETNPTISKALHMSERTVRFHINRIAKRSAIPNFNGQARISLALMFAAVLDEPSKDVAGMRAWLSLTSRQKNILALIMTNRTTEEIAEALYVKVDTVQKHINEIFKHVGVSTRLELVSWYNVHFGGKFGKAS